MIGLGAAMVTQTLTFAQAFSAFATEIPWRVPQRIAHAPVRRSRPPFAG